ncbi:polysaccharide pyruvyl transferase family protein [Microbacterium sp. C7(2022)]|uniref:polysaccharide pyruvyl transferase family protein n=1 Tax=Microbacterium sp. C7(2022) TaxID=2992759 RepID=UPI00237B75B6|nr:polysaccharide pyruvyl transferase family protein [Microbacterium sp. C7(2022)]
MIEGVSLRVYVGDMPDSYINAFGSLRDVMLLKSGLQFQLELIRQASRVPVLLAFAPGPQIVQRGLRSNAKLVLNTVNARYVQRKGGAVVSAGRSFRHVDPSRTSLHLIRRFVKSFNFLSVRDRASLLVVGSRVRVGPDLAFAGLPETVDPSRVFRRIAFSFRYDFSPDPSQFASAARHLREADIDTVLVSQVGRDDEVHRMLSEASGVRLVAWGDRGHAEQEHRVRSEYSTCSVVVSNRLHALLLGAQAGATPVIVSDGRDKLSETLAPWLSLAQVPLSLDGVEWADIVQATIDKAEIANSRRAAVDLRESMVSVAAQMVRGSE